MLRIPRALAIVVAAVALSLAGAGRSSGAEAPPTTAPTTRTAAAPAATNDLVPTDQNVTDCVGTLERPNCGSEEKSDARLYATFAVLMIGMGFIGWRIAVGIRQRDREDKAPEHTF